MIHCCSKNQMEHKLNSTYNKVNISYTKFKSFKSISFRTLEGAAAARAADGERQCRHDPKYLGAGVACVACVACAACVARWRFGARRRRLHGW